MASEINNIENIQRKEAIVKEKDKVDFVESKLTLDYFLKVLLNFSIFTFFLVY